MTIKVDIICISPNHYGGRTEGIEEWLDREVKEKRSKGISLGNTPGDFEEGARVSIDGYGGESVMVCCLFVCLFVCELYSSSKAFTELLFTSIKIQVGRTIFKTKIRPKF